MSSTVDLYAYRTMMAALRVMKKPRRFLRDTFFKGIKMFTTKAVDIDVIVNSRKIAAYVSPMAEGKVVEGEGYSTKSFAPPYLKEKMSVKPQDLFEREAGSTIYAPGDNPSARAQRELGEKLANLERRFSRLEEYQCRQALDEGKVTVVGEGINATVDFGMPAAHKITLTGNDLWTDTDNSNPFDNLIDWSLLTAKSSGLVVDTGIIGTDAWKAFRDHPKVTSKLDNRRVQMGQIVPRNLPEGVTYLGSIVDAGVDVDFYAYAEWFIDPADDQEKPMVPVDKLWLGSSRAQNKKLYGAIQDLKAGGLAATDRFPKSWEQEDPSVRWVMLQSAPLMGLLQPDAFISAKVI